MKSASSRSARPIRTRHCSPPGHRCSHPGCFRTRPTGQSRSHHDDWRYLECTGLNDRLGDGLCPDSGLDARSDSDPVAGQTDRGSFARGYPVDQLIGNRVSSDVLSFHWPAAGHR